jgi:hypothetical protein
VNARPSQAEAWHGKVNARPSQAEARHGMN